MNYKTLPGTVLDVSAPFFVTVPNHPTAYEVLVILFMVDYEVKPRTLFTASNLYSGFDKEFTTLLFSKGKRMLIKAERRNFELLNGLGDNIISVHEL